jgi:FtsP/CotA-like multicopper oxidase with cupredoxin domain
MMIYSWGYGCAADNATFTPAKFVAVGKCPTMQMPGPTLVVTEGQPVTVTLKNNLPASAGNTSIVFTGQQVTASSGVSGLMAQEAAPGGSVTYAFTASGPGTYAYYSGTRSDLQIEMGLYGALIVLPDPAKAPKCAAGAYSLAGSAYDHPGTCYDREYLFQFSELSLEIHQQIEAQVKANVPGPLNATIEPYHPEYFLVNGRSMPDDMDDPFAVSYPHQPYNGNPHMHPGDLVLMRVIGQGRIQHPFHHHGNHVRVLARDGNLLLSSKDNASLAGPLQFTIATVSGQSVDAIFTWTGQGLNWDVYGSDPSTQAHSCNGKALPSLPTTPASLAAVESSGFDPVTKEYCPDHGKPIPVTPADPNILANGLWYGGSPYLGNPGGTSGTPISTQLPPPSTEINLYGSYAYMWHSHDEREITTNDVFPGGMMMMLMIDPPAVAIDETH